MGRGSNDGGGALDLSARPKQRHRPGEEASEAFKSGKTAFSATIIYKLFPKKGQAEKEDGYTIAKATHEGTGEEIILKGRFGPVTEGELIQIKRCSWRQDVRWGEYCQVWAVSHEDPVTREALLSYLENLPGVGPAMAGAIVDELGTDCLAKIDNDPSLLERVKVNGRGISASQLDDVREKWEELRAQRKVMLHLSSLGIGDSTAKKILMAWGSQTEQRIKENPYAICEIKGVGFRTADLVAQKLGIGTTDTRRIGAGIEYLLEDAEGEGHICLSEAELAKRAPKLLRRGNEAPEGAEIDAALEQMIDAGRLWREADPGDGQPRIYTTEHFMIETRLYEALSKRLTAEKLRPPAFFKKREDSPITDEQWGAIEKSFTESLSVLTGGPGTGKTTTLRELISELEREGQSVMLLAPTGKAAKRMEESTGQEASTIHRALGWEGREAPSSFRGQIDREQRFGADVVVVDEASMLDMRLAERLFSHLDPETRVVLVGDPDQLPAVGAGSVLHDLIESERVPKTKLTKIFRQAEDSLLVVNSHRIKDGLDPYWSKEEAEQALGHSVREDFRFIETESAQEAISATLKLARELPGELGTDADGVMVAAPSKKGDAGVYVLNQALQGQRNPDGLQFRDGDQPLRVGDRVMNTQNRYGKQERDPDVMNGDIGKVSEWEAERRTAWVDFGHEKPVPFSGEELEGLIPAYAATVHKLQGSESPGMVVPLIGGGSRLLSRNLVYTAATRAKQSCVLVGDKQTLREALKRDGRQRKTTLDLRVGQIRERIKARWETVKQRMPDSADELLYG
jgi:exodeoxyribonuclease V alpha subunit